MLKKFWRRWGSATLVLLAVLSLVATGVYAQVSSRSDVESEILDVKPYLPAALPQAAGFELLDNAPDDVSYLYVGLNNNGNPVGYVTANEANGYYGGMIIVVGWSLDGTILTLAVPEHHEPRIQPMYDREFLNQYIGRQYSEPLELKTDIDAATGATFSSRGVARGVQQGRELVAQQLDNPYLASSGSVSFGLAEILLLVGLGSVVTLRLVPRLKKFRWTRYFTLAFGLAVLGIWLVRPLSLIDFTIWAGGVAPSWQSNLFLYILVFGVIVLALVFAKNFYCFWLCPFAAVQEGVHFIGGGRVTATSPWQQALRNTRYGLLWLALLLALLFQAPEVVSFEPWDTLFSLEGSAAQWLLVAVTLIAALFVYDFFCHYLCPVGAVMDIILKVRRRFKAEWFREVGLRLKEDRSGYSFMVLAIPGDIIYFNYIFNLRNLVFININLRNLVIIALVLAVAVISMLILLRVAAL